MNLTKTKFRQLILEELQLLSEGFEIAPPQPKEEEDDWDDPAWEHTIKPSSTEKALTPEQLEYITSLIGQAAPKVARLGGTISDFAGDVVTTARDTFSVPSHDHEGRSIDPAMYKREQYLRQQAQNAGPAFEAYDPLIEYGQPYDFKLEVGMAPDAQGVQSLAYILPPGVHVTHHNGRPYGFYNINTGRAYGLPTEQLTSYSPNRFVEQPSQPPTTSTKLKRPSAFDSAGEEIGARPIVPE